jgi:RES domain-containing protein
MNIFRVSHERWRTEIWTGNGGLTNDGRWNTKGRRVVYASDSLALAVLENLVQQGKIGRMEKFCSAWAEVPDELIATLDRSLLPKDWDNPVYPAGTQALGDQWLDGKKGLVLKVPSAVIHSEYDFVINPEHPLFGRIKLHPAENLNIDPRLCV